MSVLPGCYRNIYGCNRPPQNRTEHNKQTKQIPKYCEGDGKKYKLQGENHNFSVSIGCWGATHTFICQRVVIFPPHRSSGPGPEGGGWKENSQYVPSSAAPSCLTSSHPSLSAPTVPVRPGPHLLLLEPFEGFLIDFYLLQSLPPLIQAIKLPDSSYWSMVFIVSRSCTKSSEIFFKRLSFGDRNG